MAVQTPQRRDTFEGVSSPLKSIKGTLLKTTQHADYSLMNDGLTVYATLVEHVFHR